MLKDSLKKELATAIETSILLSPKSLSSMDLAKRILESEKQLVEQFQESWVLERLSWMVSRRITEIHRIDENQYLLPGFERLPRRLAIRGHRTFLRDANLDHLKSYREILSQKQIRGWKAKMEPVDRLIDIIIPYDKKQHGITVAQVMAAEKDKQE